MKILFYSSLSYDKESFGLANKDYGYEIEYLDAHLTPKTALFANGYDVACVL